MYHDGGRVLIAGEELERAQAAMIMLHGRGAPAESILTLAEALPAPGFVFLAPQAAGNSWWPQSFLAPGGVNDAGLESGLRVVAGLVQQLQLHGVPVERTIILGFSQGAVLALEFAARHARHYGGVAGLSGGLFGPPGTPRDYAGSLAGTPVFLGCSDIDAHIPLARVQESAEVLGRLGARVDMRIYPGMGHTVNADEIQAVHALMAALT